MKKIVGIVFLFLLLFSTIAFSAKDGIKDLLSDYPYISDIERSIIIEEVKEAVKFGVDEYDLESLISLAKRRKISPLELKDIISFVSQAAKLHLFPDLLINKAKEGLLKRVREDLLIEALRKRLEYLRTANLIINSLGKSVSDSDRRELTFIIVQTLENGLSEDVITELINYAFKKKVNIEEVSTILNEISTLPALGLEDDAILKLGEFFFKRKVPEMGIKEVTDAIVLAIRVGVLPDKLSEFLAGAYRYKDYASLRNAILRFAQKNRKNKKKKVTPINSLPPPPSK